jgi:hypothetical protein
MNEVVGGFQLPGPQTKERLTTILGKTKDMNPAVQSVVPNYQKLNDTRSQVSGEVETLVRALGGQK